MKAVRVISLVALAAALSGCFGLTETRPAPVSEAGSQSAPRADAGSSSSEAQVAAYEPAAPVQAAPVHGKAVTALLASAQRQEQSGDYAAAVGTVERALRIEPRNAYLWNRLANLRLQQGRFGMASELAEKSTALAGADMQLKQENWALIARAKRQSGDLDGAREAERKARQLY